MRVVVQADACGCSGGKGWDSDAAACTWAGITDQAEADWCSNPSASPPPSPPGCLCSSGWLGDGQCDWSCNIPACNYDAGDCPSCTRFTSCGDCITGSGMVALTATSADCDWCVSTNTCDSTRCVSGSYVLHGGSCSEPTTLQEDAVDTVEDAVGSLCDNYNSRDSCLGAFIVVALGSALRAWQRTCTHTPARAKLRA